MIVKVTKHNKISSFEMSPEVWDYFWANDFDGYKIGYIIKGYVIEESGDQNNGWLELYYNDRRTLRQEWCS